VALFFGFKQLMLKAFEIKKTSCHFGSLSFFLWNWGLKINAYIFNFWTPSSSSFSNCINWCNIGEFSLIVVNKGISVIFEIKVQLRIETVRIGHKLFLCRYRSLFYFFNEVTQLLIGSISCSFVFGFVVHPSGFFGVRKISWLRLLWFSFGKYSGIGSYLFLVIRICQIPHECWFCAWVRAYPWNIWLFFLIGGKAFLFDFVLIFRWALVFIELAEILNISLKLLLFQALHLRLSNSIIWCIFIRFNEARFWTRRWNLFFLR